MNAFFTTLKRVVIKYSMSFGDCNVWLIIRVENHNQLCLVLFAEMIIIKSYSRNCSKSYFLIRNICGYSQVGASNNHRKHSSPFVNLLAHLSEKHHLHVEGFSRKSQR